MIEHLYEDLSVHLYEGEPITKKAPTPPPITYLTQWKMMGNSVVHTDEYLTQWKVEGNSVVDNNAILSCGDLGQDGKYHVKISNGVDVFDIALTEPLRKVNDVADTIEFVNGVATLTRNISATKISDNAWRTGGTQSSTSRGFYTDISAKASGYVLLCAGYNVITDGNFYWEKPDLSIGSSSSFPQRIFIKDLQYTSREEFLQGQGNNVILYELATPTTEVIQAPQISVSPTDTYTSANDTPYSAFEYKKNVEIWSCGEYNATDGKYHILVQPLGGNIVDIALDEPLRKVNDATDKIEFADGVATVTRNLKEVGMTTFSWRRYNTGVSNTYRYLAETKDAYSYAANEFIEIINTGGYKNARGNDTYFHQTEERIIGMYEVSANFTYPNFAIYDPNYNQANDLSSLLTYLSDKRMVYRLATPTTETIQVPQIQEADSYTCVISQGGKAVSWSSFITDND